MGIRRRKFIKNTALFSVTTMVLPIEAFNIKPTKKVRFGLVADSHYADREPNNTRFYKESLSKMEAFITLMNQQKVDFIVHLGDFKDEDEQQNSNDTLNYLKKIENVFSQFNSATYHCVGNHDVDSITKQQFLTNITNTGIDKDKSYYSFNNSGFHFVVLDGNYDSLGKDHFYKNGADWQDVNIPKQQLEWLQKDLAENKLPTIVFCHHTLFEFTRGEHHYHVKNYTEVQRILENSKNVISVFQGHVHEESHAKINNIHYITQLGMVDYSGLENNSFAVVEIDENAIKINGYKRATNKTLTF